MKYINRFIFHFFLLIFLYFPGRSQDSGVVIDEIIGRVDDYIVLRSELESTYLGEKEYQETLSAQYLKT